MPIDFLKGQNGRLVPVQKIRTVYAFMPISGSSERILSAIPKADDVTYYVSHFETCPKASEFSRSKR